MGWTSRAPAPPGREAGRGYQHEEHPMSRKTARTEPVATIGIDIGKTAFHLIGLDQRGAIALRQKLSRSQVEARLANTPTPSLSSLLISFAEFETNRRRDRQ